MERDCLCQLIEFQYNASQLTDDQFFTFCNGLIRQLKRDELSSILFCGLNAMRMRGCRSSLAARDIIHKASNITFKITTKHKAKWNERNTEQHAMVATNTVLQYSDLPCSLIKYLCDYLDIQSLLNQQLISRYFCVITRKHRNYALLLTVSPYHPQHAASDNNIDHSNHQQNYDQLHENTHYLHSVQENALNCGYYKKFFIPIKKLGSGSYGSVYLVNHVMHGIYLGKFAIKLICVGDDLKRLINILREVRTLQPLHHRNVIDYKHSWLENYQPAAHAYGAPKIPCLFILMEYADMGSVYDYIILSDKSDYTDTKWLTEHEIWTIMFETCMGLQHLHEHGIVHRDIKPANLLMTSLHKRHKIEYKDLELYNTDYRILISDLGQADFVHCKESVPETGNTGAFGFAAPELILRSVDHKNVNHWDESSDIWSLGQLLYFLSFSRMPYADNDEDSEVCDVDIKMFYKDIVNGTNKLWFPPNHVRSSVIPNMIHSLCQINPQKRPSLDFVIEAICNILRSHQYISISYSNNDPNRRLFHCNFKALTASEPADAGADISKYPVIKYIPKYCGFPII